MRKLLALSIVFAMILVSVPAITAEDECCDGSCGWVATDCHEGIITTAHVVGGGVPNGGGTGGGALEGAPIIKCKWEYDMCVILEPADPCCDPYCIYHDACPCEDGLEVKPTLGGNTLVGYYAIVSDPQGVQHIDHVYADVWHPNGEFKYQFELFPVGLTTSGYDKSAALAAWDHVTEWHYDLICHSDFTPIDPSWTQDDDITYELEEEEAYLYYGEAWLSYCQPAGKYCVGVRAYDGLDMWSDYLFNKFWYIPTAAVALDFTTVNYGDVVECVWQQKGGDKDMTTTGLPTVKNVGNTMVYFTICQDDMGFGKTGGAWNVEYKARLSKDGIYTAPYSPDVETEIPGQLGMCTEEKLDFVIHVIKGFPGTTNTGTLDLCAHIYDGGSSWVSPLPFDPAPTGIPQNIGDSCPCNCDGYTPG
jgi:hypothetical protein